MFELKTEKTIFTQEDDRKEDNDDDLRKKRSVIPVDSFRHHYMISSEVKDAMTAFDVCFLIYSLRMYAQINQFNVK